ncbi:monoheme cytochrome c [Selenomonas sputigena]|uniref:Monoheme cytochrome c n=1 Tax=Selenomonas sputigena TaxID=69823 RepID=A0ABV3X7T4_9FIRM
MVDFEWNQEEYENAIREEGIEQGLERGKAMVVLGMLKEKLPLETIARVSDLSLDKIKEVGRLHSLL